MSINKVLALLTVLVLVTSSFVFAQDPLDGIVVHSPIRILKPINQSISPATGPVGYGPSTLRAVYSLPSTGGTGTIAIIDPYDNTSIQNDFNVFSMQYGLPTATASNFEIHKMNATIQNATVYGWDMEQCLDVEWSHAIAPNAKILFVEAISANLSDIFSAVDYARTRSDVVAISMSLGAGEFAGDASYDSHFISPYGASFFASAGDDSTEVLYPAASPNVIAVGGTLLNLGVTTTETAWNSSGGGLSTTEFEPSYQVGYGVKSTNGFRGVPDVSYNGDPNSGVAVYDSSGYGGWSPYLIGGTSAGAPQWAAIRALGGSKITNPYFYQVAATPASYAAKFRDITSGSNGPASYYTEAHTGYDYITGLGSPIGTGLLTTGVENWEEQRFDLDFSLTK